MMAVSASFHRNILLLSQIITPNDEFKKHFREGMFDKPNTAGFLHVSYYLLTIYDSERFKKIVEWPVTCKKTEAKYRNNVKDYLTIISAENPDIGFPNILMSHLIHAGGSKFTIIMWKLSQVVVRRYITRKTTYNIVCAPQVGNNGHLTKKFFHEINEQINSEIFKQHKNLTEMRKITKLTLEKERENLDKIRAEIFEREQVITNLSNQAPVHPSIKKRLRDLNDEEVIKMWRINVTEDVNYIQKRNKILKETQNLTFKINNVIQSYSNNVKILDAKQLLKINPQDISELFPPDIQCLLFQLYKNDRLLLHNFIILFNYLLNKLHQHLKLNMPDDFSDCLLQIVASSKDIKSALYIIQSYLLDLAKMILDAQSKLCQINIVDIHNDTPSSIMNNVLIMSSPLIKLDTNCNNEESDLQKRLQLTPVEAAHKSLFLRYESLKQNQMLHGSKLRENLLVSRINFDETVMSINSERQSSHISTMSNRKNFSSVKHAEKYSRLFSTRTKRNNTTAVNSSIMSIPCSSKANSTTIANAIEGIHDISEISLNVSTKSLDNISVEFVTPKKLTVKENKSENTSEMEDAVIDFSYKPNIIDKCGAIEVEIKSNYDNNIIRTEQTKQTRRSIGDLVERYKKLLAVNNHTLSPKLN